MATRQWVFRCEDGHHHKIRDDIRWNLSLIDSLPVVDGMELPFPDPGGDIVSEIDSSHLIINVSSKKCPQKYPTGLFPSSLPVSVTMQKMMEMARAQLKKETSDMLEKMKSDIREEMVKGLRTTLQPESDDEMIDEFLAQRRKAAEAAAEEKNRFPDLREKLDSQKKAYNVVNLQITTPSTQEMREVKKAERKRPISKSIGDDGRPEDWNTDEAQITKKEKLTVSRSATLDPTSNKDFADTTSTVQKNKITRMYAEFVGRPRSFINGGIITDYFKRCAPIVMIKYAVWTRYRNRDSPETEALETLLDPLTNTSFLTGSLRAGHYLRKRVHQTLKPQYEPKNYIRWLHRTQFNLLGNANLDWYAEKISDDGTSQMMFRQFTNFEVLDSCEVEIPVLGLNFLEQFFIGLNPEATEVLLMKEGYKTEILRLPITRWVILTERVKRDETGNILGAHNTPDLISKLYDYDKSTGIYVPKTYRPLGDKMRQVIADQIPRHFEYGDLRLEKRDEYYELREDDQYDTQDDRFPAWNSFEKRKIFRNPQ